MWQNYTRNGCQSNAAFCVSVAAAFFLPNVLLSQGNNFPCSSLGEKFGSLTFVQSEQQQTECRHNFTQNEQLDVSNLSNRTFTQW